MSLQTAVKSILAAAVLGSVMFSGVAQAREATVFTVRLAQPAEQARIITPNTLWQCEGDTCLARARDVSVRTCRQFTREANVRVTAFGNERRQLSADELSRCNEGVAAGALQAQN